MDHVPPDEGAYVEEPIHAAIADVECAQEER
jgi:hypothetical protein